MILDRNHWPWFGFVLVASAVAGLLYLANFHPDLLPFHLPLPAFLGPTPPLRGTVGGSPLGLIYGIIALLIFIFAAMLGARRKKPAWRIGRVQVWLKAHIWLTLLTVPLIALHCDFSAGGPMTQLLLALYAVVMVSGFYGLALQHFLPRIMKEQIPLETIFEQIPHLRNQMLEKRIRLSSILTTMPIDNKAADQVADEIGKVAASILKAKIRHDLELRSLLTPDQQIIFDARPKPFLRELR